MGARRWGVTESSGVAIGGGSLKASRCWLCGTVLVVVVVAVVPPVSMIATVSDSDIGCAGPQEEASQQPGCHQPHAHPQQA